MEEETSTFRLSFPADPVENIKKWQPKLKEPSPKSHILEKHFLPLRHILIIHILALDTGFFSLTMQSLCQVSTRGVHTYSFYMR